jgi:hypothetical protein
MVVLVTSGALAVSSANAGDAPSDLWLDMRAWRIIPRESGKVDYYRVLDEGGRPFIRAEYKPPYETAVLGYRFADADRERARTLRWTWRAVKLPAGGNECASGKEDSAAVVYVTWKRGLRYYTIKYVWSGVGTKGAVCGRKRNPFVAQDTVIVESGGPLDVWRNESIDLRAEYRKHFEDGDPNASVPEWLGVGIMSDGDQTHSDSVADYGAFVLGR